MPYLKYYSDEHKAYPHEHGYILNRNSTVLLTTHLLYVSNLYGIKISFSLNANLGNANYSKKTLKYHKSLSISLLVVCHEVGHLIDRQINGYGGKKAHTKRHKKIVKKMIDYCRKNNYFGLTNINNWDKTMEQKAKEWSVKYDNAPTLKVKIK